MNEMKTIPATQRSAEERRRFARLACAVEIGVYSESDFYLVLSEDISEGGIFVSTADIQPVGSMVRLEFILPGGHQVHCVGEVRWLKDPCHSLDNNPGMGIRFASLEQEHVVAITDFVSERFSRAEI